MRFVETPVFTMEVRDFLADEEYRALQLAMLFRQIGRERQAGQVRRGEMKASRIFKFAPADIKAIRERLGKSQSEFALLIGVSVSTLRNWEQGRRSPEGPARALLMVAS